jgi:hypothetical protein
MTFDIALFSMAFQFQYGLEGTKSDLDLGLSGFTSGQPLKPKTRFDEILNTPILPLSISKSDDLIRNPCNERDEDHPRGHLISERKVMRDEGKDQDAHYHDDEQEACSTPGMKEREILYPIDHQRLTGLEGKDRFVLRTMILKNTPDLFKKGDGPEICEEDDQSYRAVNQVEEEPAFGNYRNSKPQPPR